MHGSPEDDRSTGDEGDFRPDLTDLSDRGDPLPDPRRAGPDCEVIDRLNQSSIVSPRKRRGERWRWHQSFIVRSRSALLITETELRLMAAPAIIGLSSKPKKGYSRPAATGMPRAL